MIVSPTVCTDHMVERFVERVGIAAPRSIMLEAMEIYFAGRRVKAYLKDGVWNLCRNGAVGVYKEDEKCWITIAYTGSGTGMNDLKSLAVAAMRRRGIEQNAA